MYIILLCLFFQTSSQKPQCQSEEFTCGTNSGFGERNIVHIFVPEGSSSPDPYMEILLEITLEMYRTKDFLPLSCCYKSINIRTMCPMSIYKTNGGH